MNLISRGIQLLPAIRTIHASAYSTHHPMVVSSSLLKPLAPPPALGGRNAVTTAVAAALNLRGGGADAPVVDLLRIRFKLEALSAYGLTSTILMSSALGLYASTPKKLLQPSNDNKNVKIQNAVTLAFILSASATIVSGMTSSVIFSLLGLYAKTAIGMGNDAAFLQFVEVTTDVRKIGFRAMVWTLLLMKSSLTCSVFLHLQGTVRYVLSFLTCAMCIGSFSSWWPVVHHATVILYGH